MKLILHQFELPLKHEFTIAYASRTTQETLIVELREVGASAPARALAGEAPAATSGFGEATTNPYYDVTLENMSAALEATRPAIEKHDLRDPAVFWEELHTKLSPTPFAQCALDEAAHDLWGKKLGQPVHRLWGLDPAAGPPTDYTIGIDAIETMVAKLNEFPNWPVYKIKLGTPRDVDIIKELRQHTSSPFRVDANCGWSVEETLDNAARFKDLDVEFIEQPLPADDWEGMRKVYRHCALPVIADESCIVEADVEKCHGYFNGVNIKLTKCGGLTPARRMITRARQLGMKVMVGCMTESTVGISAIAQLLPLLDYVDMDGALLLAKDIATGVRVVNGRAVYPDENGCGVRLLSAC